MSSLTNRQKLMMLGLLILVISAAHVFATGTPAGTSISNQAVVTYQDANGITQTPITSNVVTTAVAQAYGVDVFTAQTPQNTLPGSIVYYPITVTNTGNGSDSYNLTTAGTQAGWTRTIYVDTNGNGVVDPGEPVVTSTGTIEADSSKKFVISVGVPAGATNGTTDTMTVTATGIAPSDTNASVTDVTNVTTGAVLTGTKGATPATIDPLAAGAANRTVTYTINITNTGAAAASSVVVEDVLPTTPLGVLLAGVATSTAGGTLEYFNSATTAYEAYSSGNLTKYTKVRLTLTTLAVNASAQLSFQAVVPQFSAPGTMNNFATVAATGLTTVPTNTSSTTLLQTAGVSMSSAPGQTTSAGGSVTYTHIVTNTGNGKDHFILVPATVPAGWNVQLFNADGVTPIPDPDGSGYSETPDLPAGGSYTFVSKIISPTSATPNSYPVIGVARSGLTPSVTATVTDTTTIVANPLVTATKTVSNTSPSPGAIVTYTISYSVTQATAFVSLAQDQIPANTTFVPGTITGGGVLNGGIITWDLGNLPAGTNSSVSFQVQVNANVPVGTSIGNTASVTYNNAAGTPMPTLTATAPTMQVAAIAGVTFIPNNTANAIAGTTQIFGHLLANSGNASDDYTLTTISPHGWPMTLFIDVNGDGILQPTDTQVTGPITVGAGTSVKLLVRVQVPAGTPVGIIDNGEITATSGLNAGIKAAITDSTTVVAANAPVVDITKVGAVDTTAGAYVGPHARNYNNNDGVAEPGATLIYTITYINAGTGTATNVVITDHLPANTTLVAGSVSNGGTISNGIITWTIGTVAPNATGTVQFKVTIN